MASLRLGCVLLAHVLVCRTAGRKGGLLDGRPACQGLSAALTSGELTRDCGAYGSPPVLMHPPPPVLPDLCRCPTPVPQRGYHPDDVQQYMDSTRAIFNHPNVVPDIRIRRSGQYRWGAGCGTCALGSWWLPDSGLAPVLTPCAARNSGACMPCCAMQGHHRPGCTAGGAEPFRRRHPRDHGGHVCAVHEGGDV